MADTTFGTNDPRTQKKWSNKLFKYAVDNMWLTQRGLMGMDPNNVLQVDKDLSKGAGDKITFELLSPLTGTGQGDDGNTEDNAEALSILNMSVEIHERAHRVQAAGKMSMKRTSTNIREAGKTALGLWLKEKLEDDAVAALSGLYNEATTISTVNENEPTSSRIWRGGQTAAGAVASDSGSSLTVAELGDGGASDDLNYLFGPKVISIIKRMAKMADPKIRPLMIDGQERYVMLLHPWQVKALRNSTEWSDKQAEAGLRGSSNPIFSGALGVWDGVILHEYDRIAYRLGEGGTTTSEGFELNAGRTATEDALPDGVAAARALFLGAQAGALAWGQMPKWYEDGSIDAGRIPAVVTDTLYGVSKTVFNTHGTTTPTQDYGVIAVDTCVVPD